MTSDSDMCHGEKRIAVEWPGRQSFHRLASGSLSEEGAFELSPEWWNEANQAKFWKRSTSVRLRYKDESPEAGRSEEQKSIPCVWSKWDGKVGRGQPCQSLEGIWFYFICTGKTLGGFKPEVEWSDLCFIKKTGSWVDAQPCVLTAVWDSGHVAEWIIKPFSAKLRSKIFIYLSCL